MKFTTILFTFLGLLTAVAALPLSEVYVRYDATSQALQERFVDENDPIFARYFGPTTEISERDYEDGLVEPRQYAKLAEFVIKGVLKIVNLIKGKLEQDKKVRSNIYTFEPFIQHYT